MHSSLALRSTFLSKIKLPSKGKSASGVKRTFFLIYGGFVSLSGWQCQRRRRCSVGRSYRLRHCECGGGRRWQQRRRLERCKFLWFCFLTLKYISPTDWERGNAPFSRWKPIILYFFLHLDFVLIESEILKHFLNPIAINLIGNTYSVTRSVRLPEKQVGVR